MGRSVGRKLMYCNMSMYDNNNYPRKRAQWQRRPVDRHSFQELSSDCWTNEDDSQPKATVEAPNTRITVLKEQFESGVNEKVSPVKDYSNFLGWVKNNAGIYERKVRFRNHGRISDQKRTSQPPSNWRYSIGCALNERIEEECEGNVPSQSQDLCHKRQPKLWRSVSSRHIADGSNTDTNVDCAGRLAEIREKLAKSRENLPTTTGQSDKETNRGLLYQTTFQRPQRFLNENTPERVQRRLANQRSSVSTLDLHALRQKAALPDLSSSRCSIYSTPQQSGSESIPDAPIPPEEVNVVLRRKPRPISWAPAGPVFPTDDDGMHMTGLSNKCLMALAEFRSALDQLLSDMQIIHPVGLDNTPEHDVLISLINDMQESIDQLRFAMGPAGKTPPPFLLPEMLSRLKLQSATNHRDT